MEALTLTQVAQAVRGELRNPADLTVYAVVIDNRLVTTGCLFVAIRGERFDGHDFIPSAFESGAAAAVSDREIETDRPYILVKDTREALLDLARCYRRAFDGLVVGVTGSVGKTTTKEMIAAVLSAGYKTLKTQGNLNNAIGLPRTIFELDSTYEAAVIEMGMSALGEISLLTRTALPDIGVITNIGVSHLETLGTRENILKAKLEILEGMAPGAPLVINGDNDLLQTVQLDRPVLTCGIDNPDADYRAVNIQPRGFDTEFAIVYGENAVHVLLPAIGEHNVLNALFGFAVGRFAGMEDAAIATALGTYTPSGMRQNTRTVNGVMLIEDCYNASPDSMRAALTTLQQLSCAGRKIAVLGDMLELGPVSQQAHAEAGELAQKCGVDALFCFGALSRETAKHGEGIPHVEWFDDKQSLAQSLSGFVQPGDAVIFKASRGMKLEEVIHAVFDK